jgi:lysophospholipase L1-like esterase
MKLLLVGDSDIAFWPRHLLPSVDGLDSVKDTILLGQSGATLGDVATRFRLDMISIATSIRSGKRGETKFLVVACAGENDIGNGLSLDSSLRSLEAFLDQVFSLEVSTDSHGEILRIVNIIFLGPKFEPWLESDTANKKRYSKMSRSFSRLCNRHVHADRIHFVDCLTMFCGDSANVPGAVLGGRACAEIKYFTSDQLHLNNEGYRIWKESIEQILQTLPA